MALGNSREAQAAHVVRYLVLQSGFVSHLHNSHHMFQTPPPSKIEALSFSLSAPRAQIHRFKIEMPPFSNCLTGN